MAQAPPRPPPQFPDMKSLFRRTIEIVGDDVFERLSNNSSVGSCCVNQVSCQSFNRIHGVLKRNKAIEFLA